MEESLQTYAWYTLWSAIFLCVVAESIVPRRSLGDGLRYRWLNNGLLTVINIVVSRLTTTLLLVAVAALGVRADVGFFNHWSLGFWPELLIAFVVFELLEYWMHRALHAFPLLWRLHAVHHSDTHLDFSSAFRHHPFEAVLSALLYLPLVLLVGLPPAVVLVYQLFRIFMAVFSHSNIYLPKWLDECLKYLVVTPDYHRTHHSSDRTYTDSNFASSLPVFDLAFGSARLRPFVEQERFEIGLEYLRSASYSRLDRLLLLPFRWPSQQVNSKVGAITDPSDSRTGQ